MGLVGVLDAAGLRLGPVPVIRPACVVIRGGALEVGAAEVRALEVGDDELRVPEINLGEVEPPCLPLPVTTVESNR
jgi:hypothetical protein